MTNRYAFCQIFNQNAQFVAVHVTAQNNHLVVFYENSQTGIRVLRSITVKCIWKMNVEPLSKYDSYVILQRIIELKTFEVGTR